jgi:site-specific recombinase XerD
MTRLAPTLQAFFTERLIRQRQASTHTITAYRDALKLLVGFTAKRAGRPPSGLDISDINAEVITSFLDHLQDARANTVSTRDARLAAIRSLFRFAALRHPEHAATIEQVLAIPTKRSQRTLINYLVEAEVNALLAAPDRSTWVGRRDHTLLVLAVQTGLRASELLGLRRADLHLGTGAHVACQGKGRKDRITPLTADTISVLRAWIAQNDADTPATPLFTTIRGTTPSRDALERRLSLYVARASSTCPTLREKTVTAHVLRHTTAMRLLHAGV